MNKIKKLIYYIVSSINTVVFFLFRKNIKSNTVLVISHGMSMSGAPLVLQDVIALFQEKGYEPLLLFQHDGRLRKFSKCKAKCCFFFEKTIQKLALKNQYPYIFVNTIACYKWICFLSGKNVKYNLWIHEGEEYFSRYNKYLPKNLNNCHVFYVSNIPLACINKYSINCRKTYLNYSFSEFYNTCEYDFDNKERIVLLVGSICRNKNQMELLDAIDLLKNNGLTNVKFIFVGSPIETDYGKEFLKRLKDYNCVEVIDYLEHDKMMNMYQHIFVSVCSSIDDSMPVTITEAVFSKRLVIVSSGTGQYKTIKNNSCGFYYNVHDVNKLADCLNAAFNLSSSEYKAYTNKAYSIFKEQFSKNKFVNTLLNEMESN